MTKSSKNNQTITTNKPKADSINFFKTLPQKANQLQNITDPEQKYLRYRNLLQQFQQHKNNLYNMLTKPQKQQIDRLFQNLKFWPI